MKLILQTTRKISFSAFILGVCLFSAQTAFSQGVLKTWDGGAGTNAWSDAANWNLDVLPANVDSVVIAAGQTVNVTSGTAVCRKLGIYGSGSSQGKVTVTAALTVDAVTAPASTGNVNNGHAVISLFGGMIDNQGTITVTGRQNLDAIRFDNPTSGTLSSTYMGAGTLNCNTSAALLSGVASGGSNGTIMTFAQTSGTAIFTTNSSAVYNFNVNILTPTTGIKSIFYCAKGTAKIDGTGTITTSGGVRSIRVIASAINDAPNLTIETGVTMNLSTTLASINIGMILLDPGILSGTSVSMTNKGTLNFSGDIGHPIYMTNATGAATTTNFTNDGTININGTFADATASVTTGGINMAGNGTTLGNAFTNTGFINLNTASGGTSTKPVFIASTSPKNLITNSGTITVGTFGTPAIGLRLGNSTTTMNNTGTVTIGAGSLSGSAGSLTGLAANGVFNNNTNGIVNLNSGANSSNVLFTNAGGTFNVPITQRVGRLTFNSGTVAIADGATFTVSTLTLTSVNIPLGTGNITIENGGSIVGGGSAAYIVTNGTGKLTQTVPAATSVLFPIGQSAMSYDPVTIKPAAALGFGARVGLQSTALGTNPVNPALVVNREWDITGTAGTTDLTFTSSAKTKDGSTTRPSGAVGVLGHYNGATWDDFSAAYASDSWTLTGYTGGFSPFIVASPGAVLSVELAKFTATPLSKTNLLTWETASEINNKGFDVQRQTATGTWETLGFVNGIGKAATYTFEDKGPLSISYYRLRQIDFDGKETLSKIVSVSQTKGLTRITPNPTSDKVNIFLNQNDALSQAATLVLSDMAGRQILAQSTTTGTFQLDMSNLAKGMYIVTLQSNNAIYQEKIIRQ